MTGREAYFTLAAKRPVFGDDRCIQARDVLRLVVDVKRARRNWESPDGLNVLPDDLPDVSDMNEEQLRKELEEWRAVGFGKDWR